MKRQIALLLTIIMLVALTACKAAETPAATEAPAIAETPITTDAPAITEAPVITEAPASEPTAEGYNGIVFSLETLTGETIDETGVQAAKLTMVNFWATWCGPCVGEMPELAKLYEAYKEKGLLLIGVQVDSDNPDGARSVMSDAGVTYPVVPMESVFGELSSTMQYIPTTMFFDSNGKQVGEAVVGAMDYDEWAKTVDALLEQVG